MNNIGCQKTLVNSNPYYNIIKNKVNKESIPKNSKIVGCCICGETEVTLYKYNNSYICKDCKILEELYKDDEEDR